MTTFTTLKLSVLTLTGWFFSGNWKSNAVMFSGIHRIGKWYPSKTQNIRLNEWKRLCPPQIMSVCFVSWFRSVFTLIWSVDHPYPLARLRRFEIQVRSNLDRGHFLALYLVLRTFFCLINSIFYLRTFSKSNRTNTLYARTLTSSGAAQYPHIVSNMAISAIICSEDVYYLLTNN